MGNLKEIVGIKNDQDFQTLVDTGKLTYGDQTIEFSDDALYFTPEGENGGITEEYVDQKIADLVNSAPETLDTLGELAQAISDNGSVVDALNSAIGNKASKSELVQIRNYMGG
jgi:phosphopantothenoylcysteine synthetase/decarboxylase